jgi:hypothetical protein
MTRCADVAVQGEVGPTGLVEPGGSEVELDQLGVLGDRGAEAEPEVERHADHQTDVAALQPVAAGA